jgi:predicted unusual protein kinase regulating ubiquinone biosynthesis (AarF/ABC1/UbiB family)
VGTPKRTRGRLGRIALVGAGVTAVASAGAAVATVQRVRADADLRERLSRQARVYRLTVRRGAHWLVIKARGVGADEERRAALDEQFAIRTAEDVAAELGNMKGAIMKLGQMVSFIAEGLPPEARAALASLQQDVPPMAPSLAEQVVIEELGARPTELFLDWDPVPVAAASIGQVHKAVLHDGREVAVKVQYPGVGRAIKGDLDSAETLYAMFSATMLKGLDPHAIIDELRARMFDELDYRLEAKCQTEFWDRYHDHPFIRIPRVVPERSAERVLTTEWADGRSWAVFEEGASADERQRAAEVVFRFAQGSVHRDLVFNGDPHPGNYRFGDDGSVTFFDFGLVKRWTTDEFSRLMPILDLVINQRVEETVAKMEEVGFIKPGHPLDPQRVFECVSAPYRAYFTDEFTFDPSYTAEALQAVMDLQGPYGDVIRYLNMPASFVILDRVVWGVSALMGRLHARNRWRAILEEYRHGAPPATELGELEQRWQRDHRAATPVPN